MMNETMPETILLVEDEVITAMAEKMTIGQFGYQVLTVDSGEEAVRYAADNPQISLILMDIDLGGGMDGTEAARQILAFRTLPIVFLTSHSEKEMVERVRGITRYGYVIKNSGDFVLQSSIEMAFELFRAHERLQESEERFRGIFETSPIGIAIVNTADQRFLQANESFRNLVGYSDDELRSMSIYSLTHPDDQEWESEMLRRHASEKKKIFEIEKRYIRKDGEIRQVKVAGDTLAQKHGKPPLAVANVMDVTEQLRARKELEMRESMLDRIFDLLPVGLWFADKDGTLLRGNPVGVRIWGAEPQVGQPEYGVFKARRLPSSEEIAPHDWALAHSINEGVTVVDEMLEIDSFDGKKKIILNYTAPVTDDRGNILGGIVVNQDITERTRAEEALKRREREFSTLVENARDIIVRFDTGLRYIYCNRALHYHFGIPASSLIGKTPHESGIPPADAEFIVNALRTVMESGKELNVEQRLLTPGGAKWFLTSVIPEHDEKGRTESLLAISRDITDRRQAEEEIQTLLKEKDMLLREIHHRIRNNLGSMDNLLTLQLRSVTDGPASMALQDAQSRVRSMILLYDRLNLSADYTHIGVKDYLESLSARILDIFPGRERVAVHHRVDEFTLDARTVFPLGLIINELLTNSMKHAFPGEERGILSLSAAMHDGVATITVEDNGRGFPAEGPTGGFGLNLISMLVRQLRGTMRMEHGPGTRVIIDFPCRHSLHQQGSCGKVECDP
jgi:PAS domain S-box-containing protein